MISLYTPVASLGFHGGLEKRPTMSRSRRRRSRLLKLPPRHMGTKSCVWWSTRSTCPRYSPKQRPNLRKSLFQKTGGSHHWCVVFQNQWSTCIRVVCWIVFFEGKTRAHRVCWPLHICMQRCMFINRGYAHQSRNLWIWDVRMAFKCADFKSLKTLTTDINHGKCLWLDFAKRLESTRYHSVIRWSTEFWKFWLVSFSWATTPKFI